MSLEIMNAVIPVLKGASKCPGCGVRFMGERGMSDAERREIEEEKKKREREREKAKKERERAKRKKEQLARLQEMPEWQKPLYKRYISPGLGVGCLSVILAFLLPSLLFALPNSMTENDTFTVVYIFLSLPIMIILLRLSVGMVKNAEKRSVKVLGWAAIISYSFWIFAMGISSCAFFF